MTTKKMPKNAEIFLCEICDFKCCKLSNYNKHLLTSKHLKTTIRLQNTTKKNAETSEKCQKMPKIYYCNTCDKQYNHHSSLWKHRKNCKSRISKEFLDFIKNSRISVWESQKGNGFWTFLKMSKIEKALKTFEKNVFLLHNLFLTSGYRKNNFKINTIILKTFKKKGFRGFFC